MIELSQYPDFRFIWTGVGSRDVPHHIDMVQPWIGECMCLLGGMLSTGDAPQSDSNFLSGYEMAENYDQMPPARVYYTRLKNQKGLTHDSAMGHMEFEYFGDLCNEAQQIAYDARGSFQGLYPSGIALHARNAMQVLQYDLLTPSKYIVYYAIPKGRMNSVSGGTNTARKIAEMYGVKSINLYHREDFDAFVDWIYRQLERKGITPPPYPILYTPPKEAL